MDWYLAKVFTRRRALLFGAALAGFALPLFRRPAADEGGEAFVIVNGWVLKRDDLRPR